MLSSLLGKTSNLRQYLPASEADGDTTDDTHICRVLRAYYEKEKGVPRPDWLPRDPKDSTPAAYGQMGGGGRNNVSNLFADTSSPEPQQPATQSLRQNRPGGGARMGGLQRREPAGSPDGPYAPQQLSSYRDGSYQSAPAPSQPMLSAADRLKLKGKNFAGRSGSTSPSLGAQSGSNLRPPGGNQRQASYESGRADYLERSGQRGYR